MLQSTGQLIRHCVEKFCKAKFDLPPPSDLTPSELAHDEQYSNKSIVDTATGIGFYSAINFCESKFDLYVAPL